MDPVNLDAITDEAYRRATNQSDQEVRTPQHRPSASRASNEASPIFNQAPTPLKLSSPC